MAILDGNGLDRLWSHIETNINNALAKYFGTKADIGHTHSYDDLTDKPEISAQSKTLTEHLAEESMVLTSLQYGDELPDPGIPGRIFFKRVTASGS